MKNNSNQFRINSVLNDIFSEAFEPDKTQFIEYVLGILTDSAAQVKMALLEEENFAFADRVTVTSNYIKRRNIKTVEQYFAVLREETKRFKMPKNDTDNDLLNEAQKIIVLDTNTSIDGAENNIDYSMSIEKAKATTNLKRKGKYKYSGEKEYPTDKIAAIKAKAHIKENTMTKEKLVINVAALLVFKEWEHHKVRN